MWHLIIRWQFLSGDFGGKNVGTPYSFLPPNTLELMAGDASLQGEARIDGDYLAGDALVAGEHDVGGGGVLQPCGLLECG